MLPRRGRPRRVEKVKLVKFRESTFQLWNEKKKNWGHNKLTNSEFAEILLHRGEHEPVVVEPASKRRRTELEQSQRRKPLFQAPFQSTPDSRKPCSSNKHWLEMSPFSDQSSVCIDVDVTSLSVDVSQPAFTKSRWISFMDKINESYGSLPGNPFDENNYLSDCRSNRDHSSSESDGESGENDGTSDESDGESDGENREEETLYIMKPDSCSFNSSDMDISERDASATLTAIFESDVTMTDTIKNLVAITPENDDTCSITMNGERQSNVEKTGNKDTMEGLVVITPENDATVIADKEGQSSADIMESKVSSSQVKTKLKEELVKLSTPSDDLMRFVNFHNRQRVIADVDCICDLFSASCQVKSCVGESSINSTKAEGGVLTVTWVCSKGHSGVWNSSALLGKRRGQNVFASTALTAAGVLISGNNFEKIQMMMKFCNIHFVSESTFNRIQSLCVLPAVRELWERMKCRVWDVLKDTPLVLSGDGRNDSPGHSAKYSVYTLMEHFLDVIIDVEIVDVRETRGVSCTMERLALRRLIERTMKDLHIKETVTDASSMIIKLLRDLKEQYPQYLGNMTHSLDMWHKSCKITTKLSAAAKIKGCEAITEWIEPIRNHFWYCAENCSGNFQELKDMWMGVVHHICGEHEWLQGECSHGPLTCQEEGKTCLQKDSKAHQAVRDIVFDKEWLRSLVFYVLFRHTSKLENFNSMMLKYASKRIAFSYEVFIARILLAVLDHNNHLYRNIACTRDGKPLFKRVYSKRSGNWRAETVKEEKTFPHWSVLGATVLRNRIDDDGTVVRPVTVSPSNPLNLAPNIAMREPPSTSCLVEKKVSRFTKKTSDEEKACKESDS